MKQTSRLRYAKELFLLAYPVSLGQVSHVMTNIADTVMLGNYNADHLAGATFAFNVFIPLLVFSIGFSMGITPFVTFAHVKNEEEELKSTTSNGLILFSFLGIALLAVGFAIGLFIDDMNQPEQVVTLAKPYYLLLCVSLVPVIFSNLFKQTTEGLSFTKPAMIISFASNGLNIVLNYILIYGKLGFEPMGIVGAGIATLISRVFLVVFSLFYILRNPLFRKCLWNNPFIRYSFDKIKVLAKVSFPISLQFAMEVTAFAFSAIMIGWLGTTALAAHQIAITIASTTYLISTGFGAAATVKIGQAAALNDHVALKEISITTFLMAMSFMGFTALFLFFSRDLVPLFFVKNNELEIIEMASSLLIIAAIFQLSDGLQVAGHGVLRGIKDVKIPTLYSVIAYWVFGVPMGYFLSIKLGYGIQGFWFGLTLGLTILALLLYLRVKKLVFKVK